MRHGIARLQFPEMLLHLISSLGLILTTAAFVSPPVIPSINALRSVETATADVSAVQIKLPIVQVYVDSRLEAEFVMGDDVKASSEKLDAYLRTKSIPTSSSVDTSSYTWPIENIYTDKQLESALSSNSVVLLRMYRVGCRKCAMLEPIYDHMATERSTFKFLQANINHIPSLVKATLSRLRGETKVSPLLDCLLCNNTGYLPCLDCASQGYVKRGSLAVTCPTCVGYKRVRCSSCGGKCLKCDI